MTDLPNLLRPVCSTPAQMYGILYTAVGSPTTPLSTTLLRLTRVVHGEAPAPAPAEPPQPPAPKPQHPPAPMLAHAGALGRGSAGGRFGFGATPERPKIPAFEVASP